MAEQDPNIGRIAVTPDNQQVLWTGQGWIPAGSRDAIPFLRGAKALRDPNVVESFGAGMSNIAEGARQLVGANSQQRDKEVADSRQIFRDNATTMDQLASIAGEAVMTAPLGGTVGASAGLLGRMGVGAAAGGAAGALSFAEDAEERGTNALSGIVGGGVFGAVAPALVNLGRKGARGAVRKARKLFSLMPAQTRAAVDDLVNQAAESAGVAAGSLNAAARDDIRRLAISAVVDGAEVSPEMLARRIRANAAGFVDDTAPTLGQVTRDPVQIGTERNIAKLEGGDELARRFQNQQAQMQRTLRGLSGGQELDPFTAGTLAQNAVNRVSKRLQDGVKAAYQRARDNYGDGSELSLDAFRTHTGSVLRDFEDVLPAGVKTRISQIANGERQLIPEELEKLDKLVTDAVGPQASAAEYTASNLMKRELVRVWGDSGYAEAKKLASQRFRMIGRRQGINAQLMQSASDEPQHVLRKMMGGSIKDLQSLKRMIGDEPEWNDLQKAVLQKITAKAFTNADDPLSVGGFKAATFRNEILKNIGKRRLNLIFGEEQAAKLQQLAHVSDDLFNLPAGHTANLSNSGVLVATGFMRLLQLTAQTKLGVPLRMFGVGRTVADPTQTGRALSGATAASALPERPLLDALGRGVSASGGAVGTSEAVDQAVSN